MKQNILIDIKFLGREYSNILYHIYSEEYVFFRILPEKNMLEKCGFEASGGNGVVCSKNYIKRW